VSFKGTDIINIVIAGTAGQGVITLKRLIEFASQNAGVERNLRNYLKLKIYKRNMDIIK
jgi:hypothetical protein